MSAREAVVPPFSKREGTKHNILHWGAECNPAPYDYLSCISQAGVLRRETKVEGRRGCGRGVVFRPETRVLCGPRTGCDQPCVEMTSW